MIIIIGNSYFGPKVAEAIRSLNKGRVIYLNTSELWIDKILFLLLVPFSNVLYSISASIKLGGALSIALFFKKKIVQHFIGSDVTESFNDYKCNNHSEKLMKSSIYLTEIDWISREVESVLPIKTEVVELPILSNELVENRINPANKINGEKLTVLCYVGEGREEFYGINEIIQVAKKKSDVEFVIIGSKCKEYHSASSGNMSYMGWVESTSDLMNEADIYLRLTQHDGLPFSVVEALALSKYVIYNHPLDYCNYVRTVADISSTIDDIKRNIELGLVNSKGRDYVLSKFSVSNAADKIHKLLIGLTA